MVWVGLHVLIGQWCSQERGAMGGSDLGDGLHDGLHDGLLDGLGTHGSWVCCLGEVVEVECGSELQWEAEQWVVERSRERRLRCLLKKNR